MRRTVFAAIAGFVVCAAPLAAQRSLLFVENSQGGDVSVIDAFTLKVTGTIPIGLSPDEIVARIDEEVRLFKQRLQSAEAQAAFGAFLNRKR